MKTINLLLFTVLFLAMAMLWGCEPTDPGSPMSNQPPDTRIVVAPALPDTVIDTTAVDTTIIQHHSDHYVSTSTMFHVQWFGSDMDGKIVGYWVSVDGGAPVYTASTDSLMAFESSILDPNDPGRMLMDHVLTVAAQDNEGLKDPSPARRDFISINYPPAISAFNADFAEGDTVGAGITFSVTSTDANPSGMLFQLSLDGEVVGSWDSRNAFQFCDLGDPALLGVLDQGAYRPLDYLKLAPGTHTLKIEAKDLGGAMATPVERHIAVIDSTKPTVTSVQSVYGASDYYPDGSVYYQDETVTNITLGGDASSYSGVVNSYRYRYHYDVQIRATPEWGDWLAWSSWGGSSFDLVNLPAGMYGFELQCRDYAGAFGDTLTYEMTIAQADFNKNTILIIDETRDGNGRPGSPDDAQCDDFYNGILSGLGADWTVQNLDYATHKVGIESYVSARDVYDQKIVIWHSDDKSDQNLGKHTTILSEYLSTGGRLIISGQDLLKNFKDGDTLTFSSGFVYTYLRIIGGKRNLARDFIGVTGDLAYGYPDMQYDPAKIPASWTGIDNCWVLTPAHRTEPVAGWRTLSLNPIYEGHPASVANLSPIRDWRTIVLGFPLYFMKQDQAQLFIQKAIEDLTR